MCGPPTLKWLFGWPSMTRIGAFTPSGTLACKVPIHTRISAFVYLRQHERHSKWAAQWPNSFKTEARVVHPSNGAASHPSREESWPPKKKKEAKLGSRPPAFILGGSEQASHKLVDGKNTHVLLMGTGRIRKPGKAQDAASIQMPRKSLTRIRREGRCCNEELFRV